MVYLVQTALASSHLYRVSQQETHRNHLLKLSYFLPFEFYGKKKRWNSTSNFKIIVSAMLIILQKS